MRVAMGLALNEIDREARAIEFYELLSSFDFMSSTPTLFNSGTLRSQLSSCYLTTVADDLDGIYEAIKENALLPSTPAAWATTGRRCARWARTSRAPTARARAWCRS
jgi:ribonucleotide reductase alpha subunit